MVFSFFRRAEKRGVDAPPQARSTREIEQAFAGRSKDPTEGQPAVLAGFLESLKAMEAPRVLEIGTRRSNPERATIKKDWAPHASEFIGCDYEDGIDVDVVADIHALSETFARDSFDAVICASTFEHVLRPWVAAVEIAKILKPGGWVYVNTHQSFPLHGMPYDFWRFSRESLESLFGEEAGFGETHSQYAHSCDIHSEADPGTKNGASFLNVSVAARKTHEPLEWRLLSSEED